VSVDLAGLRAVRRPGGLAQWATVLLRRVGNRTQDADVRSQCGTEEEAMWLALAAVMLAAAIGFTVLAMTMQDVEQ
jgi:hypothetical protein